MRMIRKTDGRMYLLKQIRMRRNKDAIRPRMTRSNKPNPSLRHSSRPSMNYHHRSCSSARPRSMHTAKTAHYQERKVILQLHSPFPPEQRIFHHQSSDRLLHLPRTFLRMMPVLDLEYRMIRRYFAPSLTEPLLQRSLWPKGNQCQTEETPILFVRLLLLQPKSMS